MFQVAMRRGARGAGGVVAPFIGIKLIDLAIGALRLV